MNGAEFVGSILLIGVIAIVLILAFGPSIQVDE